MGSSRRLSMHPSDVRLSNALAIITALREERVASRTELARALGLSVPAVHRLISELVDIGLVDEVSESSNHGSLGRPATSYAFRESAGCLLGIDLGNESTRFLLSDISLDEKHSVVVPTASLSPEYVTSLARVVGEFRDVANQASAPLIGVGVGVAASVDPESGALRVGRHLRRLDGVRLARDLASLLGCRVAAGQDDHYSALAESSAFGTCPDARSLVVLEIGFGIGIGMSIDGVPLPGVRGRFGRVADWPTAQTVLGRSTHGLLGDSLTGGGLVNQFHALGGDEAVDTGSSLFDLARSGDVVARRVVEWAAVEIVDCVRRLFSLCDPDAVVLGGGIARSYDFLAPMLESELPEGMVLRGSVLRERAVVTGALLEASKFVEDWLREQMDRDRTVQAPAAQAGATSIGR